MKNKTIFIVEDDPNISELIEIVLKEHGYSTKIFLTGKNIEKEVEKKLPNLIIMDLWMPDLDGASLTKKLKSNKNTSHIPIILVSAKNALEKITKKVKANGFISKPFNIKELVAIVKKFVK